MSAQPELYASINVSVSEAPEASVTVDLRSTLAVPSVGTVTFQRPSAPRAAVAGFQSVPSVAYQTFNEAMGSAFGFPCAVRPTV